VSTAIRVIALGQFAVLCSYLSETDLSVQVEQAVFRLEMAWDCWLYPHLLVSLKKRRPWQEDLSKQEPRIKVAVDELRARSLNSIHKQLQNQKAAPLFWLDISHETVNGVGAQGRPLEMTHSCRDKLGQQSALHETKHAKRNTHKVYCPFGENLAHIFYLFMKYN
jgi:hypothetical protein